MEYTGEPVGEEQGDLRDWREVVPTFDQTAIKNTYLVLRSSGMFHEESVGVIRDLMYRQLRAPGLIGGYTMYVLAITELTEPFRKSVADEWGRDRTQLMPVLEQVDSDIHPTRELPTIGTLDS